ncbi:cytochrome b/b6 domain-containing protein [Cereibacter changlensis]|nr:cytochrome b/b6 domain-containing protein [Cereibacter changlensis]
MPLSSISVWDLPLRLFHWALAVSVSGAAATGFFGGPEVLQWHIGSGLVAGGLVIARIVWGFTGSTHARFSDFLPNPQSVVEHLRSDAPRHLGHNPVGALMVFGLIGCMLVICVSGLVVLGGIFKTGPLAFWSFDAGLTGREVHEAAAWAVVGLVSLHLAGVAFESRRSGENLARSMLTGRKEARPATIRCATCPPRVCWPSSLCCSQAQGSGRRTAC